jgi:hypothetical protein
MKHHKESDFDREKKIHKVIKGSSKTEKHKKRVDDYLNFTEDDVDGEDFQYEVYTKSKQR